MFFVKSSVRSSTIGLCLFLTWSQAEGAFFHNPIGLNAPGNAITFDGTKMSESTIITNEFSGVAFTSEFSLQPLSHCTGCAGFDEYFLANYQQGTSLNNAEVLGTTPISDITILLPDVVSEAEFALSDQGQTLIFQTILNLTIAEKVSGTVSDSGSELVAFSGQFDAVRGWNPYLGNVAKNLNIAFRIDTRQYYSRFSSPLVPFSATAWTGTAVLGTMVFVARRRRIQDA